MKELLGTYCVPGAVVGVLRGDEQEIEAFGVTSREHPLSVTAETLFQIGSITKTFTATAAMRLVEMGELDLDKPVRAYLPTLQLADEDVASAVTMRHLLTHTGGWAGDYFDSITAGDEALALMLERLAQLEQLTPLGSVWSYNNSGFCVAGRVIEVLARRPFESALRTLVLDPLELRHTYFFPEDVMTHRFAVGHDRHGKVLRHWALGRPTAPVGGLITTASDLLRYARMQWSTDGFLSLESLAEMRRPHISGIRFIGDSFGVGWFLFERDGRSFMTHGGATNGQQALLLVQPDEQFALVVLTNHDDGYAVYSAIQAAVLQSTFSVAPRSPGQFRVPEGALSSYVGDYDGQLSTVRLTAADDLLRLETIPKGGFPDVDSPARPGPPETRLAFDATDAVIALDGPLRGSRGDFHRGADGAIEWLRWGGRLLRRLPASDGKASLHEPNLAKPRIGDLS